MIEVNYCLNAADFADMAALRRVAMRCVTDSSRGWIWLCGGGL